MPTVTTSTASVSYTGSGTTGPFTVPFYFLDDSHLLVTKETIATGARSTLVLTTDYTVSGEGEQAGGTVTLVSSLSSSYRLHIDRNVPLTQTSAYPRNDPFPAATHEQAVNKLTMIDQQQEAKLGRTLMAPTGETPDELPAAVERASKYLAFDANGDPIASTGTGTDTGLRGDLADTDSLTLGAALVGYKLPGTNTVASNVMNVVRDRPRSLFEFFTASQKSNARAGLGPDVTDAFQDAINEIGNTTVLRNCALRIPNCVISIEDTITAEMKALQLIGQGYGNSSSTGGSVILWNGSANIAMLKLRRCVMAEIARIRFAGNIANAPHGIEINALSGDSPVNTRFNLHDLWLGAYTGGDGGTYGKLADCIKTSGLDAQNDQSSFRNSYCQGFSGAGFRAHATQQVLWLIDTVTFNGSYSTSIGVYSGSRHNKLVNCGFATNNVDIYIAGDGSIAWDQIFSEGSTQFINAPNGATITGKGGYWQAGSNLISTGVVADIVASSTALVILENFLFTRESGVTPSPAETWKMRGPKCSLYARNVGLESSAAPTDFFDLDTDSSGDWRKLEVYGDDGSGTGKTVETRRVWTHGMSTTGWTPADGSGAGLSITVTEATFERFGDLVFAPFSITYPATADATAARIGGLPWTVLNGASDTQGGFIVYQDTGTAMTLIANRNAKTIEFVKPDGTKFTNADLTGAIINGTLIYRTSEA